MNRTESPGPNDRSHLIKKEPIRHWMRHHEIQQDVHSTTSELFALKIFEPELNGASRSGYQLTETTREERNQSDDTMREGS